MPAHAEILVVCDALVSALIDGLDDPADARVERLYLAPLDTVKDTDRHVWVFPASYENNPASRGEDLWVYQVGVIVAERCQDAGEPAKEWADERVTFSQRMVFDPLDYSRAPLHFGDGGARRLVTQASSCPVVYDAGRFEKGIFWTELKFEFREIQDA